MQNLLLTLAAAVIGAFVLFGVAAISWRAVHASDSATQYASSRVALNRFIEIIEADLSNLGAGLTNNTLTDTAPTGSPTDAYVGGFYNSGSGAWDFSSATRYLEFCSVMGVMAHLDPATNRCDRVRYTWASTGSVTVRNESTPAHDYVTVPVYRLDRTVNGTADGGSLATLTQVLFEPLDEAGDVVTDPANAARVRAVRVTLKAVSPLSSGYTSTEDAALAYDVDQTRWSRTIRPANLARVPATN